MTASLGAPEAGTCGVVVGMVAEARCLAGLGDRVRVVCSGAQPTQARLRAEALVAGGAIALISFGTAGALDPRLGPGALLLPATVVMPDGRTEVAVSPVWHRRVAALAITNGVSVTAGGALVGCDHAVTSVKAKAALAQASGALAVDMESHAVAEVAGRHGLPFLVLRAIADPALRAIPAAALVGLGPEGETRPGRVALRLLMAPWTLPALLRLAADSRASLAALRRAVEDLGSGAFRPG